jgi:hypothetical protein
VTADQIHHLHADDNRADTRLVMHACSHMAENLEPDSCKVNLNEKKVSCWTDIYLLLLFSSDTAGSRSSIYV